LKKLVIFLVLTFLVTGCGAQNQTGQNAQAIRGEDSIDYLDRTARNFRQQDPDTIGGEFNLFGDADGTEAPETIQVTINGENSDAIPVTREAEDTYIPLVTVLNLLDYNVVETEDGSAIQAGFTDVQHQVFKDSTRAILEDEEIVLPAASRTINNETYVTVSSLDSILGIGYEVNFDQNTLSINNVLEDFDFEGNEDLENVPIDENEDVPTLTSDQADRVIRSARKYIGVPYQFGASTATTRVFDCSSFTRRVFLENGITLPRTARAQARLGRRVSVAQLKKGDLVFFYWPGRFESNRVVGHVGIYIGNGNIIHTIPRRGVHIVNAARSSYWRRVYLGAKRIGS